MILKKSSSSTVKLCVLPIWGREWVEEVVYVGVQRKLYPRFFLEQCSCYFWNLISGLGFLRYLKNKWWLGCGTLLVLCTLADKDRSRLSVGLDFLLITTANFNRCYFEVVSSLRNCNTVYIILLFRVIVITLSLHLHGSYLLTSHKLFSNSH